MASLVCFTMDNLSDAADLGRGRIDQPRLPGNRPALEIGFPAMLDLFKCFEVPITHFIEGWNGSKHPEEIELLLQHGHQLGMHGWQHEEWAELEPSLAFELAEKSTQALTSVAGVRPRAFRAPGGARGLATAKMLHKLGYNIDASLSATGDEGGPVQQLVEDLWTVPYEWAAVDATHWLWEDKSLEQVETIWKDTLNRAAAEKRHLTFIWHPHIMGIDEGRREVGTRILEFVRENEDKFQVMSLAELIKINQSKDSV